MEFFPDLFLLSSYLCLVVSFPANIVSISLSYTLTAHAVAAKRADRFQCQCFCSLWSERFEVRY